MWKNRRGKTESGLDRGEEYEASSALTVALDLDAEQK
jgi:hypothetical protein